MAKKQKTPYIRLRALSNEGLNRLAAAFRVGRVKQMEGEVEEKNVSAEYRLSPRQRKRCVFIVIWTEKENFFVKPILKTDWKKILEKASMLSRALRDTERK